MILAANIGNSRVCFGFFDDDRLVKSASIARIPNATATEYAILLQQIMPLVPVSPDTVTGSIVSSVVPQQTDALTDGIAIACGCSSLVLSPGIKTGLNLKVHTKSLGADFVASAVYAVQKELYPCIIVSLGTATTFCAIDSAGAFLGTAITAGAELSLLALAEHTALLPQMGLVSPETLFGSNTAASLQAGAAYGTASMTDGICARYEAEMGFGVRRIMTGRFAPVILPLCEGDYLSVDNLLLKGLYAIYLKNQ